MTEGHLRHFRSILVDAITHAIGVAGRAQEATQGNSDTLLFEEVRKALFDFRDNSPAMKAMNAALLKGFVK